MTHTSSSLELDNDEHRIRIESLGRVVNEKNQLNFVKILTSTALSGTFDITDWTPEAIEALLVTCVSTNKRVTMKQGSRYFMLVQYPRGPMLQAVAESIATGTF